MENLIAQLNQNQNGAQYTLQGQQIIGGWNTQLAAQGAFGKSSFDLDYQVIVTLNPDNTFSYNEKMKQEQSESTFNPATGNISGSKSVDLFSGKSLGAKKSGFNMQFGGNSQTNSYSYDFEAERIKKPLFAALEAAGYKQKKSFFGKLFGK